MFALSQRANIYNGTVIKRRHSGEIIPAKRHSAEIISGKIDASLYCPTLSV